MVNSLQTTKGKSHLERRAPNTQHSTPSTQHATPSTQHPSPQRILMKSVGKPVAKQWESIVHSLSCCHGHGRALCDTV